MVPETVVYRTHAIINLLRYRKDHRGNPLTPVTPDEISAYKNQLGIRVLDGFADADEVEERLSKFNLWLYQKRRQDDQAVSAVARKKYYDDMAAKVEIDREENARKKAEDLRRDQEIRENYRTEQERLRVLKAERTESERLNTIAFQANWQTLQIELNTEKEAMSLKADREMREFVELTKRLDAEYVAERIAAEAKENTFAKTTFATLCFTGETRVNTDIGQSKAIQDIKIGDWVLSCNSATLTCEPKRVTQVFRSRVDHLLDLQVGSNVIRTTENHPFYIANSGEYREAWRLKEGDLFLSPSGERGTLEAIAKESGDFEVFNIETEGNHNFYAGNVLVHNCTLGVAVAEGAAMSALGKDFEGLDLVEGSVRTFESKSGEGIGKRADLKDGSAVEVRNFSSGGQTTIEIRKSSGQKIKIRYENVK